MAKNQSIGWNYFFDLIFVASFIQLGNLLSEQANGAGVVVFTSSFAILWIVWTCYVWLMNRFTIDDVLHRVMTFALMFVVGATSLTAPEILRGHSWKFALTAGSALTLVSLVNGRFWLQEKTTRPFSSYWGLIIGVSGVLFLVSAWFDGIVQYSLWGGAVLLIVIAPWTPQAVRINRVIPGDEEHFSERYALLTLIVLGESFVKILSDLSTSGMTDITMVAEACFVLLITCTVWWLYFDDVAGSERRDTPFAIFQWMFGHLPLQTGITMLAVGLKKAMHFNLELHHLKDIAGCCAAGLH